jgi:glutaconate CoA-transferase, subunit A
MEDYTNFSIALALQAGACGIPFIPTKSLLGTGMMGGRHSFKKMTCPFSGEPLALVPALKLDVAIKGTRKRRPFWHLSVDICHVDR